MIAEDVCREVYAETRALYEAKRAQLGGADHGFRILYGPPAVNAPILFVGYQPGGRASHIKPDEHAGWPAESHYATSNPRQSPYWRQLQAVWGKPLLSRSTGLNAIFFRAPNVASWQTVDRILRREIESFCLVRAERIARALTPQRIVVIGTGTFDRLTNKAGSIVVRAENRALVKQGELWGAPAFGVVHLSGARVSIAERDAITAYFAAG